MVKDGLMYRIVGLGEILWDVFPDGVRLGGAPANFARSVAALAEGRANVSVVSAVGDDELGHDAIKTLAKASLGTGALQVHSRPTGRVDVSLDQAGIATYRFLADASWDFMSWSRGLEDLAKTCDAVCFGTLGQRSELSRETIRRFVGEVPDRALKILDVNLRAPFYDGKIVVDSLELCNVLKLNEEELPVVAEYAGISGDRSEMMSELCDRYELEWIALTCGPDGATLANENERIHMAGREVEVVDTVGAGDAFTAAMALGVLQGDGAGMILKNAIDAASRVCSQAGATL